MLVLPCSSFLFLPLRFISKLSRTITNKCSPEKNIVIRYLRFHATTRVRLHETSSDEESEDEQEERYRDTHPLIPLGAVNSLTRSSDVRMPTDTKAKYRTLFRLQSMEHIRARLLVPLLGAAVCAANAGLANHYTCRATYSPTQIGPWMFHTRRRDVKKKFHSDATYFGIRCGRVHAYAAKHSTGANWDPDQMIFGQFTRFLALSLPAWNNKVHLIGQCRLFENEGTDEHTRMPRIDLAYPVDSLQYTHPARSDSSDGFYVPLEQLEYAICIAPHITGWPHAPEATSMFTVMDLHL